MSKIILGHCTKDGIVPQIRKRLTNGGAQALLLYDMTADVRRQVHIQAVQEDLKGKSFGASAPICAATFSKEVQ
jgi:hypothetical protein